MLAGHGDDDGDHVTAVSVLREWKVQLMSSLSILIWVIGTLVCC